MQHNIEVTSNIEETPRKEKNMSKAIEMLRRGQEILAQVEADTGAGYQGEWPPEGTWPCFLTGVSEPSITPFSLGRNAYPVDAVQIQFYFKEEPNLLPADDDLGATTRVPVAFKGREFQLVLDPNDLSKLDEKGQAIARRDLERFKGHITKILRLDPSQPINPADAIQQIKTQLEQGPIPLLVRCSYYRPEGKNISYKTEYIVDHLG